MISKSIWFNLEFFNNIKIFKNHLYLHNITKLIKLTKTNCTELILL